MNDQVKSIGGVTIHCKYDELVEIGKILPHPMNWNSHPPAQIELFKKILAYNGIRRAARVSLRSGYVTAGHGLVLTCKAMNLTHIPVDFQEYDSEDAELADLSADNQLQRQAVTQMNKLSDLVVKLDTGALDIELTGMPSHQIEALLVNTGSISTIESPSVPENAVSVVVDDPKSEWNGMPEFSHQDKTAFRSIVVHFKNIEDLQAFAILVGQKITEKTRYLWFPFIEIERYADKTYEQKD